MAKIRSDICTATSSRDLKETDSLKNLHESATSLHANIFAIILQFKFSWRAGRFEVNEMGESGREDAQTLSSHQEHIQYFKSTI